MTRANHNPADPADAETRWRAVTLRDAAFDGRFVYAVRSTGVYCRPSCPSRRAKRENVEFHASPADAERAGFRPCRRCRPDEAAAGERRAARIAAVCRAIETAEDIPSLDALARAAGLSPSHLHREFKAVTGLTPRAYAHARRGERVRDALARPGATVTEAIYDAGFNSNGRFYAAADRLLGMKPGAYRAGGADTEITFAIGQCSLGAILVARGERGISAILLGDDPDALLRELEQRFPNARLIGGDAAFDELVARVVGFVEAPRLGLDLPLDLRGTAFQTRVWEALREIPPGRTVTYSELARRIGAPKAVRAVAGACAANPVAVAVPCHRVVRTDGGLAGYRWGLARKRALLERESQA